MSPGNRYRMRWCPRGTALTFALALSLAGGGLVESASAAPRVVASIGPVHSLVAGVMSGVAEPALLVRAGASPHTYQMRPSDAATLRDADLVFWVGPSMETFLRRSIETLGPDTRVVAFMDLPAVTLLRNRRPGAWTIPSAREALSEPAPPTDDGDHAHLHQGRFDGHIWLSPENATRMVDAIVGELTAMDPENAAAYAKNGAAVQARLESLRHDMQEQLGSVREVPFVVFHDGYQYLERSFGLHPVGSLTLDPLRMSSARRLTALRDRIIASGARCVFREPQFEPALISTLVEGTDARTGVLDPLGVGITPGPDAYFELMNRNTRALLECLSP